MVEEVIAFVFAAVVMAWAFRSAAFAFSGTERAGLHELAASAVEAMLTAEELDVQDQRRQRVQQGLVLLAALGLAGALVALLIGALLA